MTVALNKSHGGKLSSVPPPPVELKRDPRYLALRNFAISISIFTILGYTILGFEQPWLWPVLALATGYSTEIVMELIQSWFERRKPRFIGVSPRAAMAFFLPAHITSLAVNMLLYANESFLPVMFGVIVGVSQKAILQAPIAGRLRHFMNPSNFGIAMTLVFFGWVNLGAPYMFTEHVTHIFKIAIPVIIITAGTIINATLTRRVPLIVGFLGGFVIQALIRWWWYGIAISPALGVMTGVAFVLFTNYMITDPGTTPSKPMNQFMFGGTVAATYGVLMGFNIVYTLFFATAITCGLRGGYWWISHLLKLRAERAKAAVEGGAGTAGEAAVAA
jgi:hypothetical protein